MYLVTGATGNVGREVVAQLLERAEPVRVFTRDLGRVAGWGDRIEVATGDFRDPDSFARALASVEAVFLMNGSPDQETFDRLVGAARASSSRPRIVFLSSMMASDPAFLVGRIHKDKEDAITASGLHGMFVRPGGFMTNSFLWRTSIDAEGVVHNALGTGRFAPVAPEDVAATAVAGLGDPALSGAFAVTGGTLLTVPEQVEILSAVLGRPLRSVDVSIGDAVQALIRAGIPPLMASAVGQSYEAVRDGRTATVTDTVARLTGRPPMPFDAWARKHAGRFA